jgi:hypothetical protein
MIVTPHPNSSHFLGAGGKPPDAPSLRHHDDESRAHLHPIPSVVRSAFDLGRHGAPAARCDEPDSLASRRIGANPRSIAGEKIDELA